MFKLSILRRKMQASSKKYQILSLVAVTVVFAVSSSYAFNSRSMSVIGKRFMSMWTWMGGPSTVNETGAYGTQGSSASTPPNPGSRESSCSWTDSSGNKWFFGGYSGPSSNYYNDLWKFNPTTSEWTWVSGSSVPNGSASYGVQGVAADTNIPGARRDCASWVDSSGIFWMFGGDVGTSSAFNDLWKYNPTTNQWTWMTGANSTNAAAVYGTQGTPAGTNTPGARYYSMTWIDLSGNLWLFGGALSGTTYNDLWKFNTTTNQWTWVNGSNTGSPFAVFGTKGSTALTPPMPGSRVGVATWVDSSGNQWYFGGQSPASNEYFNDMWKYNPSTNQWTWVAGYNQTGQLSVNGTKGVPSTANIPYRRAYATTWVDTTGKFWLFGGVVNGPAYHNGLWRFDPATLEWAWMSGSAEYTWNPSAVYGTKGVAAAANTPGGRYGGSGWVDGNKLWLFGGTGTLPNADLWSYDITSGQWTWVSGPTTSDTYGIFGTLGSSSNVPLLPSARTGVTSWVDSSGNHWYFGGNTSLGVTNDLWKYNPTTDVWTWVAGNTTANDAGNYGTKGVAAASNLPRARYAATGWIDASNNLWLWGGSGTLNDMWKFDTTTNQWTWMAGSSSGNATGVYGTKGTPSTSNYPGGRAQMTSTVDSAGNVWLFGGYGCASTCSGYLNDLWKYNPGTGEWTWISGSNAYTAGGTYGTKGTPSTSNTPGSRYEPAIWIDSSDNIWLFGGMSSSGAYNDLWRFNPSTTEWTWMTGPNSTNGLAVSGTKGVAAAANTPKSKYGSAAFRDASGMLWLYGGRDNLGGYFNDIFKYDPSINQWTWMSGQIASGAVATYGTKGVASTANTPGGRYTSRGVNVDGSGNFWFMGGSDASNSYGDVWKYSPGTDEWTWVSGSNLWKFAGVYGTVGTSTPVPPYPGSRTQAANWVDSSGNFWMFGGYGNASTVVSRNPLNDLWKYNKTLDQWTWMGGTAVVGSSDVYGTKGVAAPTNMPGARQAMSFWKDSGADVLWLYGGNYTGYYNDLWKYDIASNQWTWVSGGNTLSASGTYGTKGVPSTANAPGGRRGAGFSIDASGNFWIFGGYGYPANATIAYLNDLWKYNPSTSEWTWVSGGNTSPVVGVYGTKGSSASVASVPGGRYQGTAWRDSSGKFWLHGGWGLVDANFLGAGALSDLWSYDPTTNQWVWMHGNVTVGAGAVYGTQGVAAAANSPGARMGTAGWVDASDNLWVFGGTNSGRLNDLWKYNSTTNQWTWIGGPNTVDGAGTYGTKGVASTSNLPSSRLNITSWSNATNTFWLFGGNMTSSINDLWKYNVATNEWTWVTGSSSPYEVSTYGTKGSPAPVPPSPYGRAFGSSWTASDGTMWLFGGSNSTGGLNDLWKYDSSTAVWTWISGSNVAGASGTYGTKGTPAAGNVPGYRNSSNSWADGSGNLWLFGGYGSGYYNDLWKYNTATGLWTWMAGPSTTGGAGVYGTLGTPAAANTPGARYKSTTWIDNSGNLWLFGGTNGSRWNDLWKFDVTLGQWVWMSGSNTAGAAGVYGTLGVANAANVPPARQSAQGWVDASGNLWLFGGVAGSYFNDLWKYDIASNQWTWMSGSSSTGSAGSAGTLGIATATNVPRSRYDTVGWVDHSNNLWFAGGYSSMGAMNDLWRYNISTNQWTWMGGSPSLPSSVGVYGSMGTPSIFNAPGSRQGAVSWKDSTGNFWMFGGNGYGTTGTFGSLGDIWRYRVK